MGLFSRVKDKLGVSASTGNNNASSEAQNTSQTASGSSLAASNALGGQSRAEDFSGPQNGTQPRKGSAFNLGNSSINDILSDAAASAPKSGKSERDKIKNILTVLNIPESIELPEDVLMPEDFSDIRFSLEVPTGYDRGEVDKRMKQMRDSLTHYFNLVSSRNGDVRRLAQAYDRLQVDLNNIRLDAELASGVNIMPSNSGGANEVELHQLRVQLSEANDKIQRLTGGNDFEVADSKLSEEIQTLRDSLREAQSDLLNIKEENSRLKISNSALSEEIDRLNMDSVDVRPSAGEEFDGRHLPGNGFSLPDYDDDSAVAGSAVESDNAALPSFGAGFESEEYLPRETSSSDSALPSFGSQADNSQASSPPRAAERPMSGGASNGMPMPTWGSIEESLPSVTSALPDFTPSEALPDFNASSLPSQGFDESGMVDYESIGAGISGSLGVRSDGPSAFDNLDEDLSFEEFMSRHKEVFEDAEVREESPEATEEEQAIIDSIMRRNNEAR